MKTVNKPLLSAVCLGLLVIASVAPTPVRWEVSEESVKAQRWAQVEAQTCADLGYVGYKRSGGHPGGACPYGHFTGTGYSSHSRDSVPTCTPKRRMTLIGDATVAGVDGFYRCRVWRR